MSSLQAFVPSQRKVDGHVRYLVLLKAGDEVVNGVCEKRRSEVEDLKNEVTAMKEKAETTQKSMVKISHENKHLKGPLKEALDEVQQLKDRLKDRGKNVLALRNAKARSRSLDKELALVEKEGDFEMRAVDLNEPMGWVSIPLYALDDNGEQTTLRAFYLQICVVSMHQNGRDTHIRQAKVFGPRSSLNSASG